MPSPCRPYLPPEWAPQSGVMLTWPHPHGDWKDSLTAVEAVFMRLAHETSRREKVVIACYDAAHRKHIQSLLRKNDVTMEQLVFGIAPSNDTWARDHGPITVVCENEARLLDFQFNAWGGKYGADLDNAVTRTLHQQGVFGGIARETVDLVLEGGSIEVDGSGTLLTTTHCLLAPTRNAHVSQAELTTRLQELLGVQRILWLQNGWLAGDDTDSHIDTLARFCDPHTIAYVACGDPKDEHYEDLKAMEVELKNFRAANGRPYRLVPLPWPKPRFNKKGQRLPTTYANFLIINGAVLLPTYDDPADTVALQQLQTHFPDREIIGVPCLPLIEQYGSLHCVTMQIPTGVL